MSDTPTTAEEVITEYLTSILSASTLAPTIARQLVSVLRSSPEALADLNGGEWVRVAWSSADPVYRFVPREDR
jgi:hypothetical protein